MVLKDRKGRRDLPDQAEVLVILDRKENKDQLALKDQLDQQDQQVQMV